MELLWNDLRFALRTLSRNPGFTSVVLVTLALGIGANSAIYGLLDQVMLRPLPVQRPERLVVLDAPGIFSGRSASQYSRLEPLSHPMYEGLRDRTPVFSGVLAQWPTEVHFRSGDRTENVSAALVSGTFFPVLGLNADRGRLFSPEDDRTPGGHPLVVLGHRFFQSRFGGDSSVLGRGVDINGHQMTVIGIAPAGFHGIDVGASVDVYVPLAMQKEVLPIWPSVFGDWRTRWLTVMARLKDGVSIEQARAGANVVYAQLLQEDAQTLTTTSAKNRAPSCRRSSSSSPERAASRGCARSRAPRCWRSWAWWAWCC